MDGRNFLRYCFETLNVGENGALRRLNDVPLVSKDTSDDVTSPPRSTTGVTTTSARSNKRTVGTNAAEKRLLKKSKVSNHDAQSSEQDVVPKSSGVHCKTNTSDAGLLSASEKLLNYTEVHILLNLPQIAVEFLGKIVKKRLKTAFKG